MLIDVARFGREGMTGSAEQPVASYLVVVAVGGRWFVGMYLRGETRSQRCPSVLSAMRLIAADIPVGAALPFALSLGSDALSPVAVFFILRHPVVSWRGSLSSGQSELQQQRGIPVIQHHDYIGCQHITV